MKIKITLVILFLIIINSVLAQTPEENLKKYWFYRERLEKNFIAIDSYDSYSTNIPAIVITGDNLDILQWGDGNGTLQYYIGLLATEYKLLKVYNQDFSETRNKLLYALKAVIRLDENAEWRFRPIYDPGLWGFPSFGDLNGFFIRDDVDNDIKNKNQNLKNYIINSSYTRHIVENGFPYEQSKDNVWHYLLNLALVKKLVDDPEINKMAVDIAYRMVKYMHHTSTYEYWKPCGIFSGCFPGHWVTATKHSWEIENPATGAAVEDGANVDEIGAGGIYIDGFSYGFAEAGNWITSYKNNSIYENLHFGGSEDKAGWFFTDLTFPPGLFDSYSYRALATVAGFPDILEYDPYQFLVQKSYDDSFHPYEHFPLIFSILHGYTPEFNQFVNQEYNRCFNLLNKAPSCGTYNFGKTGDLHNLPIRPDEWSIDNRLVWPERINEDGVKGYYNGIDYMLLHNLLWLTYIVPQEVFIGSNVNDYANYNNLSFPLPFSNLGSNSNPLLVDNYKIIDFSCVIRQGGNVNIKAYNTISLLPGFEAKSGSSFTASIHRNAPFTIPDIYPVYKKMTISNTCNTVIIPSFVTQKSLQQDIKGRNQTNNTDDNDIAIQIYPNPTSSTINLEYSGDISKILSIDVFNSTGVLMFSKTNAFSIKQEFNVSHFSPGVYCLRVVTGEKVFSKNFIKN